MLFLKEYSLKTQLKSFEANTLLFYLFAILQSRRGYPKTNAVFVWSIVRVQMSDNVFNQYEYYVLGGFNFILSRTVQRFSIAVFGGITKKPHLSCLIYRTNNDLKKSLAL